MQSYIFQKSCITGHYSVRPNLDYFVLDFSPAEWLEEYMPQLVDIHYTLAAAMKYVAEHKETTLTNFNARKA